MGGLGPGYEQCIQILTFEVCSRGLGKNFKGKDGQKRYERFSNEIASELNKKYGFSGAQVGGARWLAYRYLTVGYHETLSNKQAENRRIQVDNSWRYAP